MVREIANKIKSFFRKLLHIYYMWLYKRYLNKRIIKNDFGRNEEW
jgi:hypothetical protein